MISTMVLNYDIKNKMVQVENFAVYYFNEIVYFIIVLVYNYNSKL